MGTDCSAEHRYGHFHICTENPLSLHCGKYGNKESCTRVAGYQRTAGSKNTDRSLSMVRWQWPFNQLQGLEPTACRDSPRNRTLRNRRETRSTKKDIQSEYRLVVLDGEIRLAFSKIRPSLTGDGVSTVSKLLAEAIAKGQIHSFLVPNEAELSKVPEKGKTYLLNGSTILDREQARSRFLFQI